MGYEKIYLGEKKEKTLFWIQLGRKLIYLYNL